MVLIEYCAFDDKGLISKSQYMRTSKKGNVHVVNDPRMKKIDNLKKKVNSSKETERKLSTDINRIMNQYYSGWSFTDFEIQKFLNGEDLPEKSSAFVRRKNQEVTEQAIEAVAKINEKLETTKKDRIKNQQKIANIEVTNKSTPSEIINTYTFKEFLLGYEIEDFTDDDIRDIEGDWDNFVIDTVEYLKEDFPNASRETLKQVAEDIPYIMNERYNVEKETYEDEYEPPMTTQEFYNYIGFP